jgi:TetR/AcrR family transcriptional repressor of lmrAB and yxaGH operons
MPKETYIPCLFQLFRDYGYDGATLSKISEATGLGKASLYHHFPGGKQEMVETVLAFTEQWLEENILSALEGEGDVKTRLQQMCTNLSQLYEGGEQPCILAILLLGSARNIFHEPVKRLLEAWMNAIAQILIDEVGIEAKLAQQKAQDCIIAVQGSLILAQALNDPAPFQRMMQQLPQQLCLKR